MKRIDDCIDLFNDHRIPLMIGFGTALALVLAGWLIAELTTPPLSADIVDAMRCLNMIDHDKNG